MDLPVQDHDAVLPIPAADHQQRVAVRSCAFFKDPVGTIDADAELLRMAVHNLISNAVKYSNGNPVTVTIRQPELVIEDRGIGIPESELQAIFQPFYRASNVKAVSGKGVGLALAKSILERFGASITVSSHIEEGTVFRVSF